MNRVISAALTLLLLLSAVGCGGKDAAKGDAIVDGSGSLQFTSSSSDTQTPALPESPAAGGDKLPGNGTQETPQPATEETRAVWVSYLELQGLMTNKGADQFRAGIAQEIGRAHV